MLGVLPREHSSRPRVSSLSSTYWRMLAQVLSKSENLVLCFSVWCEAEERLVVVVVHGYDAVEAVEVGLAHLACKVWHIYASCRRRTAHAAIGALASMATIGACRVDIYILAKALALDKHLEYSLRRWRTADIAQTYEKYTLLHTILSLVLALFFRAPNISHKDS